MQLVWGAYTHAANSVAVAIRSEPIRDQGDRMWAYRYIWDLRGELIAADQNTLIADIATLESAYDLEHKDLTLLANDGITIAAKMLTALAVGGTRITKRPSYPEDGRRDAEFATGRTYEIQIEGIFETGAVDLLAYFEGLTYNGTGGLDFEIAKPLTGPPQRQQTKALTPVELIQSGAAIGRLDWPVPPLPIFPADEHEPSRMIVRKDPKRTGLPGAPFYREFEVTWHYVMRSVGPFPLALPNLWPGAQ